MSRTNRVYRIAAIAGDGIGKEVMPEGLRILEAASKKYGFELRLDEFDFSSCDYYAKHGKMLPDDWKDQIGGHDAIFFGAVACLPRCPTTSRSGARCCCSGANSTSTSICARCG